MFTAELVVRTHFDVRDYDPDIDLTGGNFVFRRARIALEGTVLEDFEYELDIEARDLDDPWRDVLVNYRRYDALNVQAGRFKMPFGLEQLTSVFALPFIERAMIANTLAPARDEGVMLHGESAGGALTYQTGVFRHDGDNAAFAGEGADATWAGRVVLGPFASAQGSLLRHARFGVNATIGDVPEGLNGLRGNTLSGYTFFRPVAVSGRRVRFGVDTRWTPGPFLFIAEYNRASDERAALGPGGADLPDVIGDGWYVAGTVVLTGEPTARAIRPRRDFLRGGFGAVEVGARLEQLSFDSDAPDVLRNRTRTATLGVNWYLNRFARVSANATRESIEDPARSPILDRTPVWGAVLRLQFVFR